MIVTIWIALGCFVAGELGTFRSLQPVARSLFLLGAILCAAHMAMAMNTVYAWDHAAAVETTAAQTAEMYGVRWGGGVYVNYVFVGVWITDAIARIVAPLRSSRAIVWALRAFYFTIIVNAAVVFASPGRRWLGIVVCAALVLAWTFSYSRRGASGVSGEL